MYRVGIVMALLLAPTAAAQAHEPEVQRLLDAKKTLHWNANVPGRSERYGHSETLVDAPVEKLRDMAVSYGRYKDFHRKFATARVIGKDGDNTDVYMKLAVKIGFFKIDQWEVMRFGPPRSLPAGAFVVEARGIRGNMKDGHMIITMRPVDARHSLLKIDLLLVPTLPAPQSLVDEELRDAALDFGNGLRDTTQGFSGPVLSL